MRGVFALSDGHASADRRGPRHVGLPRKPSYSAPIPTNHPKSHSVPIEFSSFIGREAELIQIAKVQATTRLLTLVGPGGVGKSRLALRLAAVCQESYPYGIWFIEFAAVSDARMVPQAVADAIGVRQRPAESTLEATARRLNGGRALLILDNCEHLVGACSELTSCLLRACPALDLIATSREPLDAIGDIIWRVPPLSLPGPEATDVTQAPTSEALQLFVERVRAQDPRFELTTQNIGHVTSICRRLDGLPLALELVAARVGAMREADIAARLDLDLVSRAERTTEPGRHDTLRATLDWSYKLLGAADRTLLRRLAIFADGWSLQAAESVCADSQLPRSSVLHGLERLVGRSLVMFDRLNGGGTYYLLQTVHDYARERLDHAQETATLQRRHLAYMLEVAERVAPEQHAPDHAALLVSERENVRAALATALAVQDAERGIRLAVAAFPLWATYGHLAEGRAWLERFLAVRTAATASACARGNAWLGQICFGQGDATAADSAFEKALALHKAQGDEAGTALTLLMAGGKSLAHAEMALANSQLAEAQQSLHRIGSPLEIRAIWQLAIVAVELGELDRAIQLAADVQAYCRAHDIPSVIDLHLQALIAVSRGELGLAEGLFTETINASVRCNDRHLLHEAQRELGHVLLDHGCVDRARGFLAEALETECAYGGWAHVARDLEAVARSVALTLPGAAVRLAGAADGMRAARNASQWPSDRRRLASWLPEVRRRLKGSFYTMAWQAGRLLNAEQALTLARSAVQPAATAPRRQLDVLTRRERDVLALLAGALSNQAIATELNISLATTRTHVDHILVKLGLHSRTQLAVWANQHEPSHRNASY